MNIMLFNSYVEEKIDKVQQDMRKKCKVPEPVSEIDEVIGGLKKSFQSATSKEHKVKKNCKSWKIFSRYLDPDLIIKKNQFWPLKKKHDPIL